MDPLTHQLRLLCQDEVSLIEQRTGFLNQLQQALVEYYPETLEAFDDWTCPSTWDFIIEFPTAQALAGAGKRRWKALLLAFSFLLLPFSRQHSNAIEGLRNNGSARICNFHKRTGADHILGHCAPLRLNQ